MPSETPKTATFADLSLAEPVLQALNEVGYEKPSPIQAEAIPPLLQGRDVLGQAQTGTGKTAAFACPLLSRLNPERLDPQILVLTPTRELAIQVAEAFQRYASHIKGFHVLPIYGGQDYRTQLRQLKRGVHVVVGTPGRIMDHMRRGTLVLQGLNALVLDEADEMLRMGFIDDVEWILDQTPKTRQTALFSATMPDTIRRIAQKYLNDPETITIKVKTGTADTIKQRFWMVSGIHKLDALTRILEGEAFDGMIVFVRTRIATTELAEKLEARGYASAPLNGEIPQKQREKTVNDLKAGRLDILVATDVAARGLDVQRISHVINYDIPYDTEAYIHRIGRTGRAGRTGDAILFIAPREKRFLKLIERATRQKIALMELPSTERINDIRVDRFAQRITDTLANEELESYQQLIEQYQRKHNVPAIEISAALAKMVQGNKPLLLEPKPAPEKSERPRKNIPDSRTERPRKKGSDSRAKSSDKRQPKLESGTKTMPQPETERFRVEVGHNHGVKPGNIVGAIANEAGLDPNYIGRIDIKDEFSTIELPEGMPREVFRDLKKVWVSGKQLRISRLEPAARKTTAGKPIKPRKKTPKTK
ncbi:MAG: DEAD/DEAH box helicase [Pseudomonadota bacterium]|nr:DEAD/DEAH box helicase [Pseudomonadota bacterium]